MVRQYAVRSAPPQAASQRAVCVPMRMKSTSHRKSKKLEGLPRKVAGIESMWDAMTSPLAQGCTSPWELTFFHRVL